MTTSAGKGLELTSFYTDGRCGYTVDLGDKLPFNLPVNCGFMRSVSIPPRFFARECSTCDKPVIIRKTVMSNYREHYFPNTESLGADEMRITALGTGRPFLRPAQANAGWLIELGNGDKFQFDFGYGTQTNFSALE